MRVLWFLLFSRCWWLISFFFLFFNLLFSVVFFWFFCLLACIGRCRCSARYSCREHKHTRTHSYTGKSLMAMWSDNRQCGEYVYGLCADCDDTATWATLDVFCDLFRPACKCMPDIGGTHTHGYGRLFCVCVCNFRARACICSFCWLLTSMLNFFFCPMCSWLAHAVNLSFVHECLCVCVRVCEFNDDDGYKNGWTIENYSNKRLIVHMCDGLAAAGSDVRRGGWRHTVARQDAPYFVRCICSF